MTRTTQLVFRTFIFLTVLIFNTSTLLAVAFPFREFNVGDQVPDVTLQGFKDKQKKLSFAELKGKPFVAVFWGADIEDKKERSVKTLEGLESLSPFLKKRQIRAFSVNVQVDEAPVIEQVLKQSHSTIDAYVDHNRKAYGILGIFIMPTILLVDKNGNVTAGMGYSHDIVDRLRGEIEIMLGEKTPEQVMAELRPEMKELSEVEKASRRHMAFGLVMRKRGQTETAIRELEKAITINPALSEAHLELGCIYLEEGDVAKAEKAFANVLESEPDSLRAKICKAKLKREQGKAEEAVRDLLAILQKNPDAYEALYTLGRSYEDLNRMREAMDSYRKAYASIQRFLAAKEQQSDSE